MFWLFDFVCFNLQMQTMKETYLPEINELYQKISIKIHQVCSPFYFDFPVLKAGIDKLGFPLQLLWLVTLESEACSRQ